MSTIEIVGSGVVGTATGMGLRAHGHDVTFVDSSPERVEVLSERGLQARLVTRDLLPLPEFSFVAVSAPTGPDGVDITNLREATARLGRQLRIEGGAEWPVIVFRCTMPPGTMRKTLIPLLEMTSGLRAGEDFGVVYNPEYLRAVSSEEDFLHPRLVNVATLAENDRSHQLAREVLGTFGADVEWLAIEVAEFHKYVNNVGNAVKISTYNYFRGLGTAIGLTAEEVDQAFSASERTAEGLWNANYGLRDFGPYGGACLPKDTEGLRIYARRMGHDVTLLDVVQAINDKVAAEQDKLAG